MLKLDEARLDESIGEIKRSLNSEVLGTMENVASVIMPEQGTNNLVDQTIDNCKKFQNQFNQATEGFSRFIGEIGKVIDIADFLKKFEMNDVQNRDAEAATGNIDADAAMM